MNYFFKKTLQDIFLIILTLLLILYSIYMSFIAYNLGKCNIYAYKLKNKKIDLKTLYLNSMPILTLGIYPLVSFSKLFKKK